MLETFKNAYRVKNTYRVNSFVYSLRVIPLAGKLVPYNFYSAHTVKVLGYIVSAVMELLETFGFKFLYVFAAIFFPFQAIAGSGPDVFLHIFFFLTLGGAFSNHPLLDNSKDKYYALSLLKMKPREYTLSVFVFYLLKVFLGMEISMLCVGLVIGLNPATALLPGIFVVCVKIIYAAFQVYGKRKFSPMKTDYKGLVFGALAALLAYGLPFAGVVVNGWIFLFAALLALGAAVPSALFLWRFQAYGRLYKAGLVGMDLILNPKKSGTALTAKRMQDKLDYNVEDVSGKNGYAYFHRLFMSRHRRLMSRSANRIAFVCLILMAGLVAMTLLIKETAPQMNKLALTFLPYFAFIMYAVNRGQTVTQAMFMNCDHSMLAYRFYRQPKDILGLFTKRLISVIRINLPPAIVIGGGLAAILYASGGTDNPLNYVVLVVSVVSLSVFFSVHHLVMYYLLQPYNAEVEMKSKMYSIVSVITYMVSYVFIQVKLPTFEFGSAVIAFTLLYVVISLIAAYKYAPKTFKLR